MTGEVNCALFVCPEDAARIEDVAVRFALAELTTLAYLHQAQENGGLSAAKINAHVWRLAPPPRAA
jgi:hypothetical protein